MKTTKPSNKAVEIVYRRKVIHRTPMAALQLSEDLTRIRDALRALESVDSWNITLSETQAQRDFGYDMLRSQIVLLKTWERYARGKLKREYLRK